MITYKDMTFCSDDCKNIDCERNKKHVPLNPPLPVAYARFRQTCLRYQNPEFGDSVQYQEAK